MIFLESDISDGVFNKGIDNSKFWKRWTFDLIFFILIIIIFLEVIFGLIIDTFGQLNAKRKKKAIKIENNCFICGINRLKF